MTKVEFLAEVAKIVESDPAAINEDTALSALAGWDSMAAMAFLAMVDRLLGVVVEPSRLAACRKVGDLAALVADHLHD